MAGLSSLGFWFCGAFGETFKLTVFRLWSVRRHGVVMVLTALPESRVGILLRCRVLGPACADFSSVTLDWVGSMCTTYCKTYWGQQVAKQTPQILSGCSRPACLCNGLPGDAKPHSPLSGEPNLEDQSSTMSASAKTYANVTAFPHWWLFSIVCDVLATVFWNLFIEEKERLSERPGSLWSLSASSFSSLFFHSISILCAGFPRAVFSIKFFKEPQQSLLVPGTLTRGIIKNGSGFDLQKAQDNKCV